MSQPPLSQSFRAFVRAMMTNYAHHEASCRVQTKAEPGGDMSCNCGLQLVYQLADKAIADAEGPQGQTHRLLYLAAGDELKAPVSGAVLVPVGWPDMKVFINMPLPMARPPDTAMQRFWRKIARRPR